MPSCSNECMSCNVYADFCTECKQSSTSTNIVFLLQQRGKCFVDYCPQFYYKQYTNKKCILCSSLSNKNCKNCTSNTNCIVNGGSQMCSQQSQVLCMECDQGYYSLINQNGLLQCVNIIPDWYINVNNNLLPCSNDCLTCINIPTTCLTCKTLNFINNQCVDQCPSSHYSKQSLIIFNSVMTNTLICQRCQPQCNTCLNATFCTSCLIGYYLIENDGLCVGIGECSQFTYANTTTYKCQNCINPCLNCYNDNQCKQCISGYYLLGKQCLSQCPLRTYTENITNPSISTNSLLSVCSPCTPPCDSCVNATHCLSCLHSGQLIYYYQPQNTCLAQCPKGYKPDSLLKTCQLCPQNCSACDMQKCTQCKIINGQLYHLFDNNKSCIQFCPQSYYSFVSISNLITNNNTISYCLLCPNQCKTCLNSSYCTSCKQSYLFYSSNNTCLQSCPQQAPVQTLTSIINNISQYQCKTCSKEYCTKCTKYDYCLECQNMTTLIQSQAIVLTQNGQCLSQCPVNYSKQYNNQTQLWSCNQIVIIVPIDNNTSNDIKTNTNTKKQSQAKGIIISIVLPFIASYISASMFLLIGIVFLSLKITNNNNKRLFFPFCAGLLAVIETLTIAYIMFYHLMYNYYDISIQSHIKPQTIILFVAIFVLIMLSLINFGIFCKIMHNDSSFLHWKSHHSICSKFWFFIILTLSMVNFKIMNTFWSKFSFFPILSVVEKLKPFTVISGISMIPILGFVLSFILLSNQQQQIKTVYFDGIAVLLFSTLINLCSLKRPQDLFIYERDMQDLSQIIADNSNTKINLHKRAFGTDVFFINSIKPTQIYEEHNLQWDFNSNKKRRRKEEYNNFNVRTQKTEESSQLSIISSQRSSLNSSLRLIMNDNKQVRQNGNVDDEIFYSDGNRNENVLSDIDNQSAANERQRIQYRHDKNRQEQNTKNHQNVREYHSLTGIYVQNSSDILQTDQMSTQNNDQLNQAISQIDNYGNQNSQMAEFGSYEEEEENYQQENKQIGIQQRDEEQQQQQQANRDGLLQQQKIDNNNQILTIIQPQILMVKLKQNQNDQNVVDNEQTKKPQQQQKQQQQLSIFSSSQSRQHILNFIDVSQIEHNKQSLLKIDNSNHALIDDSVYSINKMVHERDDGLKIVDLLQGNDGDNKLMQKEQRIKVGNKNNKHKRQIKKKVSQVLVDQWKKQFELTRRERQQKEKNKQQQQQLSHINKHRKYNSTFTQYDIKQDSIVNNSQFSQLQQQQHQQQQQQQQQYQHKNNDKLIIQQISILNSSSNNNKQLDNNNTEQIQNVQINEQQQLNVALNDNKNNNRNEKRGLLQQWENDDNIILNRIMPVVMFHDHQQQKQIRQKQSDNRSQRQIIDNNNKQTALKISKHFKIKVQQSNNYSKQLLKSTQKQNNHSLQQSMFQQKPLSEQSNQQQQGTNSIIHNQNDEHNYSILVKQPQQQIFNRDSKITNNQVKNILCLINNVARVKYELESSKLKINQNIQQEQFNKILQEQEQEEEIQQQLYDDNQQIQHAITQQQIQHSIHQQVQQIRQTIQNNKSTVTNLIQVPKPIGQINNNHNHQQHTQNQGFFQQIKQKNINNRNSSMLLLKQEPKAIFLSHSEQQQKQQIQMIQFQNNSKIQHYYHQQQQYNNESQQQKQIKQNKQIKQIKQNKQTIIKRNNYYQKNNIQKINKPTIIKQQILHMDDNKFRQLKRKLKSIEKQQQKQQKILRKIQSQSNNHMMIASKSRQKSKDRYQNKLSQSKQKRQTDQYQLQQQREVSKFSEFKSIPKIPSKRKHKLQLQSKQHVQKIYRNSSFSNNKNNNNNSKSLQKKKSLSKQK